MTTKLDADETYRLHDKDLERLGLEIFWTEKLYALASEVDRKLNRR